MRLFAGRGVAAVSVRDVAEAAGVSPSLVIHHYKSKEGLKAAVDERATAAVIEAVAVLGGGGPVAEASASLGGAFAANLEAEPVLPRLQPAHADRRRAGRRGSFPDALRRDGAGAGRAGVGVVRPSVDAPARAAFVLVVDLAVIVMREQIAGVLGGDPLGGDGLTRWTRTAMELYGPGLFTPEAGA